MTAEGDNSVLMQKVAKERLGMLVKNPLKVVQFASQMFNYVFLKNNLTKRPDWEFIKEN